MGNAYKRQPPNPTTEQFPYLDHLLGAYFHQDFDINGDVEQIIPTFAAQGSVEDLWATIADIRRFFVYKGDNMKSAFNEIFNPDIDPDGWGMSVQEWLEWVERLLRAELAKR